MIPPERLIRSVSEEHAERLREIAEAYRSEPNRDSDDDIANAEACLAGAAALDAAREQKDQELMPERSLAGTATMENRSAGARDASRSESTDSGSNSLSPGLAPEIEQQWRFACENIAQATPRKWGAG